VLVERGLADRVVIGLERLLVGVEGDLGVDDQALAPGDADDRIGAQAAILGRHRMLGDEIGVFGEAALFKHVLERALAPPAASLGSIGERIAEPLGLSPDLLLPRAQSLDLAEQLAEGIDALGFEAGDLFFIALEALADRGKHGGDAFGIGLFAFGETILSTGEEGFLCLFKHAVAGVLELLLQHFLRFNQQALALGEIVGIGLKGGQFLGNRTLFVEYLIAGEADGFELGGMFGAQLFEPLGRLVRPAGLIIGALGAFGGAGEFGDRAAELLIEIAGVEIACLEPAAPIGDRAVAEEPAERHAGNETEQQGEEAQDIGVHDHALNWNEAGTYTGSQAVARRMAEPACGQVCRGNAPAPRRLVGTTSRKDVPCRSKP